MSEQENLASITIDGMTYTGWKKVDISAGVERQARDFSLEVTLSSAQAPDSMFRIKSGAKCEVMIGSELVLTGWVDSTPISYDAENTSASIKGRSLTSDLIDCSVEMPPNQWKKQSIYSIVKALASPYKVDVVDEIKDSTIVGDHTLQPGETIFESIDRLLNVSGLLSTDDEHGRLVLAKPGSGGRAHDALEVGKNVLSGSTELDFSKVFSEYTVKGQKSSNDQSFGVDATEVNVDVADDRITRKRKLVIQLNGQTNGAIANRRATWEKDYRLSRALATTYKVQGWRQSNGQLWKSNQIVRVVDPIIGFDRDMLIAEITYSLDDQGALCTMVVAPPEGYIPEPNDKSKKDGKGKGKKAGGKKGKGKKGDKFEYLIPEE